MRGCVSAGMIAAIYNLGLMDTFDAVYGSSAGSLVGAYAIAGQVIVSGVKPCTATLHSVVPFGGTTSLWKVVRVLAACHPVSDKVLQVHVAGFSVCFILDGSVLVLDDLDYVLIAFSPSRYPFVYSRLCFFLLSKVYASC